MTPVYQTIVDPGHGNCMQASIASIFDKKLEDVPNFIELENWYYAIMKFAEDQGYKEVGTLYNKNYSRLCLPTSNCFKKEKFHMPSIMTKNKLSKYNGVNGFFYATVFSPKYFNLNSGFNSTHAVIIDKNYKVVHDPNPEYKSLLQYPLAGILGYNGIIDITLYEKP